MDNRFQLVEPEPRKDRRSAGRFWTGASLVLVLALAFVGAGLYLPLVWQPEPVAARQSLEAATGAPVAQASASMYDDQAFLATLYQQVSPSVVNIQVTSRAEDLGIPGFGAPGGSLLQSIGSGFIYDDQGHIVTNNHVVEDAETVVVIFSNGFWAEAEIVAADPQADIAVIRVTPPDGMEWRPLPLGDADTLQVGHTVVAIGNPFGLNGTMTMGVVSALGRGVPISEDLTTTRYTLPDVIQTEAAINPGNSGGPLLDLDGRVVGINFAIRSQERYNAGVGFAIPVSIVRRVVPALIESGQYEYAYLGMTGSSIGPGVAEVLGLPANRLGVYVGEVIAGGPSEAAGLLGGSELVQDASGIEVRRGGDIIIAIDDQPVARFEDLVSYLVTKAAPGQVVRLTVLRGDGETTVNVTLGARPSSTASAQSDTGPREINARSAIAIAEQAVVDADLLTGEIVEKVATPDSSGTVRVWIVELSTETETAIVTVDAETGEVLDIEVG